MGLDRQAETPERAALRRRMASDAAQREADADGPTPHPLVALQRQVGNAQVARMLAQREGEDEEEAAAKHDVAQREEDEEEAAAKHDVAQREEDEEELAARHDVALRQEDERDEAMARPEVGLEGGPLSEGLSARINARRGGGAPLDDGTRATMERSFGTSFKDVRVHTDAESDALNRNISAKAFTTGSDIFFRHDTSPGDHALLAHELTHVVQQRGASGGGGMRVGPAGDSNEVAADSMATAVTSGAAATAAAQREADEAQAQRALAQRQSAEEEEEQAQ
ncbi:MAG TPA: DUF4157 domain-containing protein [Roseiflexaceae bacterium]|nr:DUF4157 domain-containing protein [Roseiflexaceae bacterium]